MLTIKQIFGDASDSDPISRWIPYTRFLDKEVFGLKTGGVGMCLSMRGVDYETLTQEQLELVSERFAQAVRALSPKFRVYHHFLKREGARIDRKHQYEPDALNRVIAKRVAYLEEQGLHSIRLFTTILYGSESSWTQGLPFLSRFSDIATQDALTQDQIEKVATLKDAVYAFASSVGQLLGVSILGQHGVFDYFAQLLNPEPIQAVVLRDDAQFDRCLSNTEIVRKRRHLEWGSCDARVFSLKLEPTSTFAHMLRKILRIEGNLNLTVEWNSEANASMASMIRGKRRRVWGQRQSAVAGALDSGAELQKDASATNRAESLNSALDEIGTKGNQFGQFSMIAVLFSEDEGKLRRAAADLSTVFKDADAVLIEEQGYRMRSFFSTLPGNHSLNIRYNYLLNTNYADLAPLYCPHPGSTVNKHLQDEYMTALQSMDGTPFYLNLHVGQVAGTLITGAPGSGKSVLLNQLVSDSQKYNPYTILCDIGGSFRGVTERFAGRYIDVRMNRKTFAANPFRSGYTPENVERIRQLIRVFLQNEGYTPTSEDDRSVIDEVHAVFALREERRRLGKISLPKDLRAKLHLWIDGGPYSHYFDQECDDLQLTKFQCFDFTGMETAPQLLGPLMYYVMHWTNDIVRDPALHETPKALWMDEGSLFAGTMLRDLIQSAAKQWRKHNAFVVFATQDEDDLHQSGLARVLNTCCSTKIFLPNPGADLTAYGNSFKLNERELELLGEMHTGEMLIKTPKESRRCKLVIPPEDIESYEAQFSATA